MFGLCLHNHGKPKIICGEGEEKTKNSPHSMVASEDDLDPDGFVGYVGDSAAVNSCHWNGLGKCSSGEVKLVHQVLRYQILLSSRIN